MILAVDTGNTHTVLGCIDENGRIVNVFRLQTNQRRTEHEYAADIYRILRLGGIAPKSMTGAILSTVVPSLTNTLRRAILMVTGQEALVVGAGLRTGLDIGLDDPGSIAADLVCTAVAAKELYPLPAIIIDMGTATTVTAVNESGRYIGGVIYAGVGISLEALVKDTSLLPNIEIAPPKKPIATNTVEAMKSGMFYSTVGGLDGILDQFEGELQPSTIVATGGLASKVVPFCRHKIILDDYLLLEGLKIIYDRNHKTRRTRKSRADASTSSGNNT